MANHLHPLSTEESLHYRVASRAKLGHEPIGYSFSKLDLAQEIYSGMVERLEATRFSKTFIVELREVGPSGERTVELSTPESRSA